MFERNAHKREDTRSRVTRRRRTQVAAAIAALALSIGGGVSGALSASAAELPITLQNTQLRITGPNGVPVASGQEVTEGTDLYFTTDFTLSTDPAPGDTFSIPVSAPPQLAVTSAPFSLLRTGTTTEIGTCQYVSPAVNCTFTGAVQPNDRNGFLWYTVQTGSVDSDTSVQFGASGWTVLFTIKDAGGTGSGGPFVPPAFDKSSGTNVLTQSLVYAIVFGNKGPELELQDVVTVTDTLQTGTVTDSLGRTIHQLPQVYDPTSFDISCFLDDGTQPHFPMPASIIPVFNATNTSFTLTFDPNSAELPCESLSRMIIGYKALPVGGQLYGNTPGATELFGYGNSVDVNGSTATAHPVLFAQGGGGLSGTMVMFSITKVIDGTASSLVPPGTVFTAQVDVEGEAQPRSIPFTVGESSFSGPIPDGADITITEINLPAIAGVEWDLTPTLSGTSVVDNGDGTFSVDPDGGQVVALTLTNTANEPLSEVGSLRVNKQISPTSGPAPSGVTYEFEVVCSGVTTPYAGAARAGESFTVSDIPAGADCAVTETAGHGATSVTYSAESVTIVSGEESVITATNSFPIPAVEVGSLRVTKQIAPSSGPAPAGALYGFEVVCSGVATPYAGTAAAGGSFTINGIPAAATCSVTETAGHGATSVAYSAESVTIVAGASAEVTVTNSFPEAAVEVGSLLVTKQIAPLSGPAPSGVVYGFSVVCSGVVTPYTGTAAAGKSFSITGIPAGADCVVTETASHGATGIDYSANSVRIVSGQQASVTVTNAFPLVPVVTPPTSAAPAHLASTGADFPAHLVLGALTLMLLGLGMLAVRVREQSR